MFKHNKNRSYQEWKAGSKIKNKTTKTNKIYKPKTKILKTMNGTKTKTFKSVNQKPNNFIK